MILRPLGNLKIGLAPGIRHFDGVVDRFLQLEIAPFSFVAGEDDLDDRAGLDQAFDEGDECGELGVGQQSIVSRITATAKVPRSNAGDSGRAVIMRRPLTIGQRSFETRKAASRFVRDLLYSQPLKGGNPRTPIIHFSQP